MSGYVCDALDSTEACALNANVPVFSMLPTTFGIWIDGWNVKASLCMRFSSTYMQGRLALCQGYLLKERAELYAEEPAAVPNAFAIICCVAA